MVLCKGGYKEGNSGLKDGGGYRVSSERKLSRKNAKINWEKTCGILCSESSALEVLLCPN